MPHWKWITIVALVCLQPAFAITKAEVKEMLNADQLTRIHFTIRTIVSQMGYDREVVTDIVEWGERIRDFSRVEFADEKKSIIHGAVSAALHHHYSRSEQIKRPGLSVDAILKAYADFPNKPFLRSVLDDLLEEFFATGGGLTDQETKFVSQVLKEGHDDRNIVELCMNVYRHRHGAEFSNLRAIELIGGLIRSLPHFRHFEPEGIRGYLYYVGRKLKIDLIVDEIETADNVVGPIVALANLAKPLEGKLEWAVSIATPSLDALVGIPEFDNFAFVVMSSTWSQHTFADWGSALIDGPPETLARVRKAMPLLRNGRTQVPATIAALKRASSWLTTWRAWCAGKIAGH